jgi:hypothetical protein
VDVLADLTWDRVAASALLCAAGVAIVYRLAGYSPIRKSPAKAAVDPPSEIPDPPSNVPSVSDLPTVKMMVLGLEGSGKTMMLASMYHRWAYGGREGVVLKADQETAEFLPRVIHEVETGDGLPRSTRPGDVIRATLSFMVETDGDGVRRSFSLQYTDYAGEHARGILFPWQQAHPEVIEALAQADILVGVLDGGQIARAMRGHPSAEFADTITGMMRTLANAVQKTIHLVISKWDLLTDDVKDRDALTEVIRFLDKYPPFRHFRQHPAIGVRRIIPVSAVGLNGFIQVSDDGTVRRDHTQVWEPYFAEIPVACSVPDVLDTQLQRAIVDYSAAERTGTPPRRSVAPLVRVVLVALNLVTLKAFGVLITAGGVTADDLIDAWRKLREWTDPEAPEPEPTGEAPSEPEATKDLLLRVLRLFEESVRRLEDKYPESQIGRRLPAPGDPGGRGNVPAYPPRR